MRRYMLYLSLLLLLLEDTTMFIIKTYRDYDCSLCASDTFQVIYKEHPEFLDEVGDKVPEGLYALLYTDGGTIPVYIGTTVYVENAAGKTVLTI